MDPNYPKSFSTSTIILCHMFFFSFALERNNVWHVTLMKKLYIIALRHNIHKSHMIFTRTAAVQYLIRVQRYLQSPHIDMK